MVHIDLNKYNNFMHRFQHIFHKYLNNFKLRFIYQYFGINYLIVHIVINFDQYNIVLLHNILLNLSLIQRKAGCLKLILFYH